MNRLAQPTVARPLLEQAFAKDSFFPPGWEFAKGHTSVLLNEHETAIAHFLAVIERIDAFIPARVQLARTFVEVGNMTAAAEMLERICELSPLYSLAHAKRMFPYPEPSEATRLVEALTKAGMQ